MVKHYKIWHTILDKKAASHLILNLMFIYPMWACNYLSALSYVFKLRKIQLSILIANSHYCDLS